ncbi:hypothetical protein [Flavobacterium humidisoli]|uniref:Uncharacterized protein n=1 Tax=Flavobacterium humidisoli TaxID=2937442 RepID=A0ABY4LVL6_9FLAO|nr:hypothetical protein [Flavobacterium humidisoli]UPZ16244.1 hypothetical protein M0M44_02585 [Flavobacterium humidisoli]
MLVRKIIYVIFASLSVLNSIYLSYIYLEAFMLDGTNQELSSNFLLVLISTLFIVTIIVTIGYFFNKKKRVNFKFTEHLTLIICGPVFFVFCLLFIYENLNYDSPELLLQRIGFSIEGLAIALTIGKKRDNALIKLLGIAFLWFCVATVCYSVTGIFDQHLGYKELYDNNLKLLFTAIFYHLVNACLLLYSYLPDYMTKGAF